MKQRPGISPQMFYNASRCGGVEAVMAKVIYAAVKYFGPRWGESRGQRPFRTDVKISSESEITLSLIPTPPWQRSRDWIKQR